MPPKTLSLLTIALAAATAVSASSLASANTLGKRSTLAARQTCSTEGWIPACPGNQTQPPNHLLSIHLT